MEGKHTSAFGIYPNRAAAEAAVDQLNEAGFSNDSVSILLADGGQGSEQLAHEKNTKAPEGTTVGVTAGGAIGGTVGLLAGIGALAIPGLGPLIAAGPIMAALAGVGVGGTVGGVVGALVGMGIPEYEAKRYEGRLKDGGILLSVHCESPDEISRAKEVLKQSGAEDIASAGEKPISIDSVPAQRAPVTGTKRFTNDTLIDEEPPSSEYPPDTLGARESASGVTEIDQQRKAS